MSYNGSGTFNINTTGQPVVAGTVISATAFNALTADLGVGLSTAITKDGQTTTTARITFAQGVTSSLTTDSTSTSTGSIITAGGVGIAKALFVGTTASIAGAVTLSGGTANGVAYLNGSKVLTSGSVLAFDGTRFLVGKNTSDANNWGIQNYSAAAAYASGIQMTYGGIGTAALWVPVASALAFGADAASGTTELMRLTSTGLGIGTSSPNGKLRVKGTVNFEATNSTNVWNLYTYTDNTLRWNYNGAGADEIVLDSSGNLGLGVTPSAWLSTYKALQFGIGGSLIGRSDNAGIELNSNAYRNSAGNYIYLNTDNAASYRHYNGGHYWYNAPSGTAGDAITFTQAMTLDASGNLLVGTTSAGMTAGGVRLKNAGGNLGEIALSNNSGSADYVARFLWGSSATLVGNITVSSVATAYNTTSDYRLKTVTGAVTGQGARIDALKPIDYLWTEGGQQARGFLAHEFQAVYSNSVTGDKDALDADGNPKYQSMQAATSEVIADLVAEIQSLRKRLADAGIA